MTSATPEIAHEETRIRRLVTAIAGAIAVILVAAVPAGYFMVRWQAENGSSEKNARLLADSVAKFAYLVGPTWPFQEHRLEQLIADVRKYDHGEGKKERLTILDDQGHVAAEAGAELWVPVIRQEAKILVADAAVGSVVVVRCLAPILGHTALVFLFSLLVAAASTIAVRTIPLRAVRTAFQRIARAESALQEKIQELQQAKRDLERSAEASEAAFRVSAMVNQMLSTEIASREAAEAALRQSEAQLKLVADNIPALVIYADRDMRFRFANRVAEQWYGRTNEQILGRRVDEIFSPPALDKLRPKIHAALSGQTVRFEDEIEYPTGHRWVDVQYVPHIVGDAVAGYFSVVLDITQRRVMEQHLRQAQKMEAIGQLTGGIAHDFNNLLGAIIGNLELLNRALKNQPIPREWVTRAIEAADKGASLTHRLLAFARRQALKPEITAVNLVVADVVKILRRTLREDIEVVTAYGVDPWPCRIDPGQLEGGLLNLAINARDAMPTGGRFTIATGNVVLGEAEAAKMEIAPGSYVTIAAIDTGVGMPPEVAERAFDPFFTTKEVGKGTGLGLSMVYGFVRQSGGHVRIDSEVGRGTAVTIYLPRSDAAVEESSPLELLQQVTQGSGETVLVVEDNSEMRRVSCSALEALGYRPIEAANAADALSFLYERSDVAVLFTDIVMPGGMNGFELAKVAVRRRPALKVLFTSGFADSQIPNEADLPENAELLKKPFRIAELAAHLARLLGTADSSRDKQNHPSLRDRL